MKWTWMWMSWKSTHIHKDNCEVRWWSIENLICSFFLLHSHTIESAIIFHSFFIHKYHLLLIRLVINNQWFNDAMLHLVYLGNGKWRQQQAQFISRPNLAYFFLFPNNMQRENKGRYLYFHIYLFLYLISFTLSLFLNLYL